MKKGRVEIPTQTPVSNNVGRTQSVPPNTLASPLQVAANRSEPPATLPARVIEKDFDAVAAAKELLKSQESTMAQNLPQHEEAEEGEEEELAVVIDKAPKAFTGDKPLSQDQLTMIDMLIASKRVYMNAKSAEEYELLPQLIDQSIKIFQTVKIFLGWKKTKEKVDDRNPFKERKVAEFWANHAKEQKKKKSEPKIEAPTTTGTVKEKLKGYKIPKKKKSSNAKPNKPQNRNRGKEAKKKKRIEEKKSWRNVTHLAQAMLDFKEAAEQ
ncbi:hypothetical protein PGTUg99_003708 [Puccinia graminis f. sp. tritici]|uniref:Uncharacterized protein n=1 Tax=Puccinia graminis f. sp. tritici TaxID=56615 RepID=A0A5B0R8G4_PUCGR|nr:hypothetical protein PGTUg99_003708 [Puccinia graminis f. sp. tritici]